MVRRGGREAEFRYGVVFLVVLALVVFELVAPPGTWARAVGVALAGGALVVAVATWRTRRPGHDGLTLAIAGAVAVLVVVVASGIPSPAFVAAAEGLLVVAIPVTLVRGLVRLVQERGATLQAIAGALSLYLMIGLVFASVIGFIAEVWSRPYFTQGPDVSNGDRVYFSFTVLTTTGFGDYTAATPVGHALAVLEMLSGQLYLVTVIGVLIGHFVRPGPSQAGSA
jgi:hypothetical protein